MLWCADPKSPKFLIISDVTFTEFVMLHHNKESSIPCIDSSDSVGQKVEFEITVSESTQEDSSNAYHYC